MFPSIYPRYNHYLILKSLIINLAALFNPISSTNNLVTLLDSNSPTHNSTIKDLLSDSDLFNFDKSDSKFTNKASNKTPYFCLNNKPSNPSLDYEFSTFSNYIRIRLIPLLKTLIQLY